MAIVPPNRVGRSNSQVTPAGSAMRRTLRDLDHWSDPKSMIGFVKSLCTVLVQVKNRELVYRVRQSTYGRYQCLKSLVSGYAVPFLRIDGAA